MNRTKRFTLFFVTTLLHSTFVLVAKKLLPPRNQVLFAGVLNLQTITIGTH